jgi:hypothetical protein
MGFDSFNRSLKIRQSIGTPIRKVGVHLGMWRFIPSHSPIFLRTWDVTLRLHSWLAPLQAFALVANPRLGLQHPSPSCKCGASKPKHNTFQIALNNAHVGTFPPPILLAHSCPWLDPFNMVVTSCPTCSYQFTLWRLTRHQCSYQTSNPFDLNLHDHLGLIPSLIPNPPASL